ncbi:hypothetical protein [Thalassospira povalilytica]|uniref:hypothetical protein n=1 Tax=Thalassospira povalilytica TaxID=732237 RepID=UPI003AA96397
MRKAVVPVDGSVKDFDGDEYPALTGVDCDGERCFLMEGGKLTKEDIETLVGVYEEFRSDIWKDKSECMVLAVTSIGLEVED